MVFYGTEMSPGGDDHDDDDVKFNNNDLMTTVDEDPQQTVVEGGQWKEVQKVEAPDHTHNEVQRTTTEVDAVSASAGCVALSKKGQHCIGLCLLVILLITLSQSSFPCDFSNKMRTERTIHLGSNLH